MNGAERFEELVTWQRMYELSLEVWKFTRDPPASRDFRYRDEIRDASDSAHRNVAEGFGRYNPMDFARFLDISRASALETQALLKKGRDMGYLSQDDFARLDALAIRGLQALARFQRYLRSPRARRNAERHRYRRNERALTNESNGPNQNGPNQNGPNQNDPNENDPNENDPNDPNGPNDPNE
jgi:four helix bundle protein